MDTLSHASWRTYFVCNTHLISPSDTIFWCTQKCVNTCEEKHWKNIKFNTQCMPQALELVFYLMRLYCDTEWACGQDIFIHRGNYDWLWTISNPAKLLKIYLTIHIWHIQSGMEIYIYLSHLTKVHLWQNYIHIKASIIFIDI